MKRKKVVKKKEEILFVSIEEHPWGESRVASIYESKDEAEGGMGEDEILYEARVVRKYKVINKLTEIK